MLPLISYILASRYFLHHDAIDKMSKYICTELSPKVPGGLGWEKWVKDRRRDRRYRWLFLHPIRVLFPGVGAVALAWVAAAYALSPERHLTDLLWGFAWILGAVTTFLTWKASSTAQLWSSEVQEDPSSEDYRVGDVPRRLESN